MLKKILFSLLLAIAIYALWGLPCAALLAYHEQYQLFLFTPGYMADDLSRVGGLADYIGECLVQFCYVPALGAGVLAVLFALVQASLGAACGKAKGGGDMPGWVLSAIPSMALLACFGDENALFSYPVAMLLAILAAWGFGCIRFSRPWVQGLAAVVAFMPLYYLIGPVALLFVALTMLLSRNWAWLPLGLAAACGFIYLFGLVSHQQYPYSELFLGINYYRVPSHHPAALLWPPLLALGVAAESLIGTKPPRTLRWVATSTLVAVAAGCAWLCYSPDKMQIFKYDYYVRHSRWRDVINLAERRAPGSDFALQAVNLALARTGQLGERMFDFPQTGIGGLLGKYERNNTSCLITAEAFFHLGLVNSAFRYNFDLQEAIMNDRKSGRFMKRLAECMIINGNYEVALKYIGMLKHALYYRDWAREAEAAIADEQAVANHPVWGDKRRLRFKQDMLYDYSQIDKMLALLALESDGLNLIAWDYFLAATLLKADLPTFAGMYHYAPETFGIAALPKSHQEAMAMYWTMGHPDFDGLPYQISDDAKRQTMALAKAVMDSNGNPEAWANSFPGFYGAYFLKKQMEATQANTLNPSEREG